MLLHQVAKICSRVILPLHVRRAHGAFVRPHVFTVAILAQGTNRGDALCAALLLRRVGSNPTANTFSDFGNFMQD